MSRILSAGEMAKFRAEFFSRKDFKTDPEIQKWYDEMQAQQAQLHQPQVPAVAETPEYDPYADYDQRSQDTTTLSDYGEGAFDLVANTLWGALDTASIGLAGAAWKAVDEDSYRGAMEELNDTLAGRIGGGLGAAAGFLAPMGWVGAGVGAATRVARTGLQLNKVAKLAKHTDQAAKISAKISSGLAKGKDVSKLKQQLATVQKSATALEAEVVKRGTTSTIQKVSAEKLVRESIEANRKLGTPILTRDAAQKIIKESSDDLIGTQIFKKGATASWMQKMGLAGSEAIKIEHSVEQAAMMKDILNGALHSRLSVSLNRAGVGLRESQMLKLTDDLSTLLSSRPINTIEGIIAGKWGNSVAQGVANILGGAVQESVAFGITGSLMDAVQIGKGDLKLEAGETFADKMMHHAMLGSIFGGIKFLPGGKQQGIIKDLYAKMGFGVRKFNKSIANMGRAELEALARATANTDKSLYATLSAAGISTRNIKKGLGVGLDEVELLRKSLISHNEASLARVDWSKVLGDSARDFIESSPRMIAGTIAMNYDTYKHGAFDQMDEREAVFHILLAAAMTKSGKSILHGNKSKLITKPFHYNSEMTQMHKGMRQMQMNVEHIDKVVNQVGVDAWNNLVERSANNDVDVIINELIKADIIYDSNSETRINLGKGDKIISPLHGVLAPISGHLRSLGYEINPNAVTKNMESVISILGKTESKLLSTGDQTYFLDSGSNVRKSLIRGVSETTKLLQEDLTNLFRYQVDTLMGVEGERWVDDSGRYKRYVVELIKENGKPLTADESIALGRLEELRMNLLDERLTSEQEFIAADGTNGVKVVLTQEKINKIIEAQDRFEMVLGNEVYGGTNMPADHLDPQLWTTFREVNFRTGVEDIFEVMQGKGAGNVSAEEAVQIKSIIDNIYAGNNLNKIVQRAKDLKLVGDIGSLEKGEYQDLMDFNTMLHSILLTDPTKSHFIPEPGSRKEVDVTEMKALYEKLVDAGMPDIKVFGNDQRMMRWVDSMQTHGIDKAIGGLELDPYKSGALKRMMLVGIVETIPDASGRGTRLSAISRLSLESVMSADSNLTKAQAKEIVAAYDHIMKELGPGVVSPKENVVTKLTPDILGVIKTASEMMNPERVKAEINRIASDIESILSPTGDRINELKVQLKEMEALGDVSENKDYESILGIMNLESDIYTSINEFKAMFNGVMGGNEFGRISAFIDALGRMRGSGGGKALDLLAQMKEATSVEQLYRIDKEMKDLQVSIAERVMARSDVSADLFELNVERARRQVETEIEGRLEEQGKVNVSPETYLTKYGLDLTDAAKYIQGIVGPDGLRVPGQHKNATEVLGELYNRTMGENGRDGIGDFIDTLIAISTAKHEADLKMLLRDVGKGTLINSNKLTNEMRDEIQSLASLFERKVRVKKVNVNIDSNTAVFDRGEVSSGPLTDLWAEIGRGDDLVLLDNTYYSNDSYRSLYGASGLGDATGKIDAVLRRNSFFATEKDANSKYPSQLVEGKAYDPTSPTTIPGMEAEILGKQFTIGIDENITIVLSDRNINGVFDSYIKFFEEIRSDKYVQDILSSREASDSFSIQYNKMEDYYNRAIKSKKDGYSINQFYSGEGQLGQDTFLHDALFTMVNTMYAKRINGNWVNDAFSGPGLTRKHFKYKRLAQNLGYTRNSRLKRELLAEIWKGTDYEALTSEYALREETYAIVIDDSHSSRPGELGFITENASVALQSLESQKGDLSLKDYEYMKDILTNSSSLYAEQVNGMTALRRSELDYFLLMDGNSGIIGSSAGMKPVGLTTFRQKNASGNDVIHVFYNKTHYFYDSNLDTFFKNNPEINQVTFKSGAKKAQKIDVSTGRDVFVPLGSKHSSVKAPRVGTTDRNGDKYSLTSWLNEQSGIGINHESVMPIKLSQTVSGTSYGAAHDTKIMKQFANWASEKSQLELFEWARMDMLNHFGEMRINLYDMENTKLASDEARSFMADPTHSTNTIDASGGQASAAAIAINAGGVPFSDYLSKSLYDGLIKRKYISNGGAFDGYTNAGGSPILRGNLNSNLAIPIFAEVGEGRGRRQVTLGEANIGVDYLLRNINLSSDFDVITTLGEGTLAKPNYRKKSTITIAYRISDTKGLGTRDIIIDLKTGQVYDPRNNKVVDSKGLDEKHRAAVEDAINTLREGIKKRELVRWIDIHNRLNNDAHMSNMSLAVNTMPSPRTGPHDMMLVKVKDVLKQSDGGIMELNSYDVTTRGQRDYDTDKMPFYMDTPFEILKEGYRGAGGILEPASMPEGIARDIMDLDPFNRQSFTEYKSKIKRYDKARGLVIKTQRKLTYAKILFESLGSEGMKIGDVSIHFNPNALEAQQRLTSDSQWVLDIYNGFSKNLEDLSIWSDRTYFGNSHDMSGKEAPASETNPFFIMKNAKGDVLRVDNVVHKAIINKLMNDYGRLVTMEGSIYEAGEASQPRYKDMYSTWQDFKDTYNPNQANWNMYNYLAKATKFNKTFSIEEVNQVFFKEIKRGPSGELSQTSEINPIMDKLSRYITDKNPTALMKTLERLGRTDMQRVTNLSTPSQDSFNQRVNKLIGEYRSEILNIFMATGETRTPEMLAAENRIMDDMWDAVKSNQDIESATIQLNNAKWKLERSESMLSREKQKRPEDRDDAFIAYQEENIRIYAETLDRIANKMQVDKDFMLSSKAVDSTGLQQTFKQWRDGSNNTVFDKSKVIAIRDNKTGALKYDVGNGGYLSPGTKYELRPTEVAVFNPVTIKPVVEHKQVDAIALAYSVMGYRAKIAEDDLYFFQSLVRETRKNIKLAMKKTMDSKGAKDFSSNEAANEQIMQTAYSKLAKHIEDTYGTLVPEKVKEYGESFVVSMMVAGDSWNPNEFHYIPKTGGFVPALQPTSPTVVRAALNLMKLHGLSPGGFETFVSDLAKTHRGFYDSLVAGEGFSSGMATLAGSTFEGALLKHTIDKVMHNAYKDSNTLTTMDEYFKSMAGPIGSELFELHAQMLDGAYASPEAIFGLRRQIIEAGGQEAYNNLFLRSRGTLLFDGISSKFNSGDKGEGIPIGDIIFKDKSFQKSKLFTRRPGSHSSIKEANQKVIGNANGIDC